MYGNAGYYAEGGGECVYLYPLHGLDGPHGLDAEFVCVAIAGIYIEASPNTTLDTATASWNTLTGGARDEVDGGWPIIFSLAL